MFPKTYVVKLFQVSAAIPLKPWFLFLEKVVKTPYHVVDIEFVASGSTPLRLRFRLRRHSLLWLPGGARAAMLVFGMRGLGRPISIRGHLVHLQNGKKPKQQAKSSAPKEYAACICLRLFHQTQVGSDWPGEG